MSMIQCRACEFIQPEDTHCRRCGRMFAPREIPRLPVEVVQPLHEPAIVVKRTKLLKPPKRLLTIAELEEQAVRKALQVFTPIKAAKVLGIGTTKIYRRIKQYGITELKQEKRR